MTGREQDDGMVCAPRSNQNPDDCADHDHEPAVGRETTVRPAVYADSEVALVRAVMDYIDGECSTYDRRPDHDEGCDPCAFDRLLQALPSSLQRAAIRYEATP